MIAQTMNLFRPDQLCRRLPLRFCSGTSFSRENVPALAEQRNFLLKIAGNDAEIAAAQQLRYEVFKQEQGRLSGCIAATDADRYDGFCRHLIVVEKRSGRVVGTYRILDADGAGRAGGFYSEQEFAFHGLDRIAAESFEVGRSCVAPEFRNGAVVGLLWSGLAALRRRRNAEFAGVRPAFWRTGTMPGRHRRKEKIRYLFGCASLEEVDPVRAMALYEYFRTTSRLSGRVMASPRPGYELAPVASLAIARLLESGRGELLRSLPPLFKGYLNLGAKICGTPAFDREFGTVDFPVLLDFREIPERYLRHFGG